MLLLGTKNPNSKGYIYELLEKNIANLANLKHLSLHNAQLEKLPEGFSRLKNLELLDLTGNQFSEFPSIISELKSLRFLCVTPESLNNVPKEVSELENLELLAINSTGTLIYQNDSIFFPHKLHEYEHLNIESLYKFTQIQRLDLSGFRKQIKDIDFSKFQKLKELGLHSCDLEEIPKSIFYLKNLEFLDLGKNKISTLPEELFQLNQLKTLALMNNNIKNVPSNIKKLPLDNPIKNYPYDGFTTGLSMGSNPIENIPQEIVNQGFGAIKNYFESITKGDTVTFNSAKLMIVGRGRVGKTTLLKNLINSKNPPLIEEEDTTRGIDITKWEFNKTDGSNFETRIWDFGGQQQYLTPHQFFLTDRSLYLFVWDALQEEDDLTFSHWLNQIKFFGGNSPVIIVMNKSDIRTKSIDEAGLRKVYPNIVGFHKISCENKIGIDVLREEIKKELQDLIHVKDLLPFTWKYIRDELERKSKIDNYISDDIYYSLCLNRNLDKEESIYLSNYLHDLGTIIHYANDPVLFNILILNPEWLTKAIYSIVDDNIIIENKGRFNIHDLIRIWEPIGYDRNNFGQLIKLMERFEFCFEEAVSNQYIMPSLLNPETPDIQWNGKVRTAFIYQYSFMPSGLITKFLIRNKEKLNAEIKSKFWKYGIFFVEENFEALIYENRHKKTISIKIRGEWESKKYLYWIREEIENINKRFNLSSVEMQVPCNCKQCRGIENPHLFDYKKKLLYRLERGVEIIECDNSFEKINIPQLLEGYNLSSQTTKQSSRSAPIKESKEQRMVNLFLSYSHKDENYKNELDSHLAPFKRLNKLNVWEDRQIEAGSKWRTEIFNNLNSADIILLLVSNNFINSEFCYSKELKEAIKRHEEGKAIVIPVIIKPCHWTVLTIGEIQAIPRDNKPVSEWPNPDSAYLEIVTQIEKVINKILG